MNIPSSTAQKTNAGTCPHGLPHGACPICSGMMSSGGSSLNKPRKPGEMTWEQCNAVWQQMLKAKALAQEKKEAMQAQQMAIQHPLQTTINNLSLKIANLAEKMNNLAMKNQINPSFSSKLQAFATNLALNTLNAVKNVVSQFQKGTHFIQQKFVDISDKLSAIFGEAKNSIEEKLKNWFAPKIKIKSLFEIFNPQNIDIERLREEKARQKRNAKKNFKSIITFSFLRKNKKEKDKNAND